LILRLRSMCAILASSAHKSSPSTASPQQEGHAYLVQSPYFSPCSPLDLERTGGKRWRYRLIGAPNVSRVTNLPDDRFLRLREVAAAAARPNSDEEFHVGLDIILAGALSHQPLLLAFSTYGVRGRLRDFKDLR